MRIIQNRRVPDPMMTDAEFLHRMAAEIERTGRAPAPHIGKVWVQENAMTRIGALCFVRRRQPHHEMAAERFKTLYEARYGAGNPALDTSRVIVDTSIMAHDAGMAAKLDRTVDVERAIGHLGGAERVISCVVLGVPCGSGAPVSKSGRRNDRQVAREVGALLADLDSLSTLWGLARQAA